MRFKAVRMKDQLMAGPFKLLEIAQYMDDCLISTLGKDLVVTRVTDAVAGESGVHRVHRAFDGRVEVRTQQGSEWYIPLEEARKLGDAVNSKFKRTDGKVTCMVHSFQGGAYHFHVQIPYDWLTENERERLEKEAA